jgi:hypothetical protein
LHKQAGSAASEALPHCATCGARHVISQRLPFTSALHWLPVLPTIEFVTALLVPPTSVELVTLDELFVIELFTLDELLDVMELLTLVELLESIELAAPADTMYVQSPSAAMVKRYLISATPCCRHAGVCQLLTVRTRRGFSNGCASVRCTCYARLRSEPDQVPE